MQFQVKFVLAPHVSTEPLVFCDTCIQRVLSASTNCWRLGGLRLFSAGLRRWPNNLATQRSSTAKAAMTDMCIAKALRVTHALMCISDPVSAVKAGAALVIWRAPSIFRATGSAR